MKKKEVFSWGMYDLANTIFSALFVTFFFPFYVKQFLGGNEFQIGLVFGLSMLLVGVVVPIIGAWSDTIGKRMPFIVFFTTVCCILTWLVAHVSLMWALTAGFFANFTYHASLTTYNALLPKVAKRSEMGNVSGIGIGMGYVGTLIALAVAALILSKLGWESESGVKAIFTGPIWNAVFDHFGAIRINGSMKKGLKVLKKGKCMGIFPEGGRTYQKHKLQPVKHTGLGVL